MPVAMIVISRRRAHLPRSTGFTVRKGGKKVVEGGGTEKALRIRRRSGSFTIAKLSHGCDYKADLTPDASGEMRRGR